ncbi:esterase-like activity of phytase family protein [Pseudoprimorskyibacter insulae]|uniref:Phytase-like domain-containing protein n=1 Tax=Pseudoprimorskyibacter insulae TaxID=1695997 RepID=A0A2R8AUC7_9RHOB|nr:esterase-like activity of phytase family protein [Pseudoprimorskyibacter insulae]SPF79651.1 hypothetical protein PRI8871_01448 [Pseudoprimorskyibacter insulae]
MRIRPVLALSAGLAAVLALIGHADEGGLAQLDSQYTWRDPDPGHGGFSGLEVADDGVSFVTIGDRGIYVEGRLMRGQNGKITGVVSDPIQPLRGPDGNLISPDSQKDSEGLAIRKDGRRYVSFENVHRVWAYLTPERAAQMPRPWALSDFPPNSSFEALAVDDRNRLYVIPERSGMLTRPFPVFRYDNGKWTTPFGIPRRDNFLPVGADIGPDGRLYLLERVFTGFSFQSRVRRFDLGETALTNEAELFRSSFGQHGNLEGLAVWRDQAGHMRLLMIADDNYHFLQRTEFVEYVVQE